MKQRMDPHARIVVLRPFNAFGPHQSAKAIIPELIIKCLKGKAIATTAGEQTREFNYVENIVDGLLLAARHAGKIEGAVNIAGGEEIRIRDLVTRIAELTASQSELAIGALPYRPNEIWRMYADSSRAQSLLGWTPKVSFDAGLRRTIAWFQRHADRPLED
jgi:nucleoside-diphosphate-sugar epimerase